MIVFGEASELIQF